MAGILGFPALVWRHRTMLGSFVTRELRARFHGSALGFFWPLIQPAALFAVYWFLFARLLGMKLELAGGDPDATGESGFAVYLFSGIILWSAFAEAVLRATGVVTENGNLIKKMAFPSELLPCSVAIVALVMQVLSLVVYFVVARVLGMLPGPEALLLPLVLLVMAVFTVGLGLLVSAMQVFLRDTMHVTGIVMTFWMFLTPIFWFADPAIMPPVEPYLDVLRLNPMLHLIDAWRICLGVTTPSQAGAGLPWVELGRAAAAAGLTFVAGYAFFLGLKDRFADEV